LTELRCNNIESLIDGVPGRFFGEGNEIFG
jgi:hypothetical protein